LGAVTPTETSSTSDSTKVASSVNVDDGGGIVLSLEETPVELTPTEADVMVVAKPKVQLPDVKVMPIIVVALDPAATGDKIAAGPAPPAAPAATSLWPRAPPDAKPKQLAFERPQANVDELLSLHANAITALKVAVADMPQFAAGFSGRVPYDELFLLRFLLSNGAKGAEKAVRATLKYRAENAALLAAAAAGEVHPNHASISQYSIADIWPHPTCTDEPVQLVRAGKSYVKKLMDLHTTDEVVEVFNFDKERMFLLCDEATRRTRRLVKMVSVIDMHSSKFHDSDPRFFKALGRASKESELYYPQLLSISIAINVPSYLNFIWPVAKRFMPAKSLAKFRICTAKDTTLQSACICPFASNVFTPDTLVDFLGGGVPSTAALGPMDRPRLAP